MGSQTKQDTEKLVITTKQWIGIAMLLVFGTIVLTGLSNILGFFEALKLAGMSVLMCGLLFGGVMLTAGED